MVKNVLLISKDNENDDDEDEMDSGERGLDHALYDFPDMEARPAKSYHLVNKRRNHTITCVIIVVLLSISMIFSGIVKGIQKSNNNNASNANKEEDSTSSTSSSSSTLLLLTRQRPPLLHAQTKKNYYNSYSNTNTNSIHTIHTMARKSSSAVTTTIDDDTNKRKKNKIKSKSNNNTRIMNNDDKINKKKRIKTSNNNNDDNFLNEEVSSNTIIRIKAGEIIEINETTTSRDITNDVTSNDSINTEDYDSGSNESEEMDITNDTTTTCTKSDIINNSTNNTNLLEAWVKHDTKEYHNFTKEEAYEIRSTLLKWYRTNRRKLPWRGDAPPYDGSTAGVNHIPKTKVFDHVKKKKQIKIDGFFNVKRKKVDDDSNADVRIAVTGYSVWVSEIMLQQTRVEAVIPYYLKWMKSFPTVQDLAKASEEEVNSHWAGLGFYRRARLLHKGSKYVAQNLNGTIPSTVKELLEIDGIGPYTAAAVASIAFDACVPVVDGNVCRVLSRLRGIANHIKAPMLKDKYGFTLTAQIVEAGDGKYAGEVNQALMEIGATYCAPHGNGVDDRDPLKDYYLSTKIGRLFTNLDDVELWLNETYHTEIKCKLCDPNGIENIINEISRKIIEQKQSTNNRKIKAADESTMRAMISHSCFPIDPPKKPKREEVLVVVVFSSYNEITKEQTWFMQKRPSKGLLAGQWEFPCVCAWEHNPNSKENENNDFTIPDLGKEERTKMARNLQIDLFVQKDDVDKSASEIKSLLLKKPIMHIFSHIRHTMYVEYRTLSFEYDVFNNGGTWMSKDDMKNVGVTAGVKKILRTIKKENIKD